MVGELLRVLVTKAWRDNLGLVFVVVSRGECLGPPTASLRGGTGVPWVSLPGPALCHRVQGDSVAERQPIVVVVGVVMQCDSCVRGRGRVSRSDAIENTYMINGDALGFMNGSRNITRIGFGVRYKHVIQRITDCNTGKTSTHAGTHLRNLQRGMRAASVITC